MTYSDDGRVGGPTVPLAGPPEAAGPSNLRQYAGTLRRRWKWVALGVLVGLLAGTAAALLQKDVRDPTTYWKATNTLIERSATPVGGSSSGSANLAQTAFLLRSADVTNGIAAETGLSPATVTEQVGTLARSDVQAIDVTAVSTDPDQAVVLADTSARILNDFVATDQQRQWNAQRDELLQQIDQLNARRAELEAAIAFDPANADANRTELAAVVSDYQTAVSNLQSLTTQGAPTAGFVTLQSATPVQINGGGYNARLQANREDRGGAASAANGTNSALASETNIGGDPAVSRITRILIGFGAGLVLGLVTAFVVEAWDDRLRRSERVEGVTGMPVIAEIPAMTKSEREPHTILAVDEAGGRVAERYRSLRTSVLFVLQQQALQRRSGTTLAAARHTPVVLVTSPSAGDGKSTTAANLAAALGDNGTRTLVVDCDYRKPAIAGKLDPVVGLAPGPSRTRLDNVWFVPAPRLRTGPEGQSEVGGDAAPGRVGEVIRLLAHHIEQWRDEYDIVILDTPPMLLTNDAIDLLPSADAVVLVLRAGQTRSGQAERASNLLRRFGADVLGIVLNGTSARDTGDTYGYGYTYGYTFEGPTRQSVPAEEPAPAPAPAPAETPVATVAPVAEPAAAEGAAEPTTVDAAPATPAAAEPVQPAAGEPGNGNGPVSVLQPPEPVAPTPEASSATVTVEPGLGHPVIADPGTSAPPNGGAPTP